MSAACALAFSSLATACGPDALDDAADTSVDPPDATDADVRDADTAAPDTRADAADARDGVDRDTRDAADRDTSVDADVHDAATDARDAIEDADTSPTDTDTESDTGPADTDSADAPDAVAPTGLGCDHYCYRVAAHCADAALYDDDDACLAACATFASHGPTDATRGDSRHCRLAAAIRAGDDPDDADAHCADAAIDGGEACSEPIPGDRCDVAGTIDAVPAALDGDTRPWSDAHAVGPSCGRDPALGDGAPDRVWRLALPTGLYRWDKAGQGGPSIIYHADACDAGAIGGACQASGDLWTGGAWTFWLDDPTYAVLDGWYAVDSGDYTLSLSTVDPTTCEAWCDLVTAACVGADAQFPSRATCLDRCDAAALPPGDATAQDGPTIACRSRHAAYALAAADPSDLCLAASLSGGGICGGWCDAWCHLTAGCPDIALGSPADCAATCADLAHDGASDATAGDSVQCRVYHAAVAATAPDALDHCAHAAPDGGDLCTDVAAATTGATCDAPVVVASLPFHHAASTTEAGADLATSAGACPGQPTSLGGASSDRVYRLAAPEGGTYRVALTADFDAALYAVADCDDVDGSCVAADDVAGPGGERLRLALEAGEVVHVVVDGWSDAEDVAGAYTLTIDRVPPGDCALYCDTVADACPGPLSPYADRTTCLGACAQIPAGDAGDAAADTVTCRAAAARSDALDDAARCRAAGPTGGGVCGSYCGAYCRLARERCGGGDAIYPDDATCHAVCADLPAGGALDAPSDTRLCRLGKLIALAGDADEDAVALACGAASPESAVCVDVPPPDGDTCDAPVPLPTPPFTVTGTTAGLADASAGCDGAATGPDAVYLLESTVTGRHAVSFASDHADRVYLLDATCGSDDGACDVLAQPPLLVAGEARYLVVDGAGATGGPFSLSVAAADPGRCGDYCAAVTAACQGPLAHHDDEDACLDACVTAGMPAGDPGDVASHGLACRTHWAGVALAEDPAAWCHAAGPSGGGVCGSLCDVYCQLAATRCVGEDALYPSEDACRSVCAVLPRRGTFGDASGDSLRCRLTHLAAAQSVAPGGEDTIDPCAAGGPTGGDTCVGDPPGERCADPIVVAALPFHHAGDTSAYDDDHDSGTCEGDDVRGAQTGDVVFAYTPEATGTYRWRKVGSGGPGVIYALTDCAGGCAGASGDLWPGGAWELTLDAGTPYRFVLDGWLPEDRGPYSVILERVP